ncbi:zf-HC2 domain-containing protein [Ammoniphilus sp. CFH 90114]|uniref:zf-HC2 domain-containing protein n=1 Tax=Ammoniphilus sp. CFH 90114 TaxID=2493665 RepID=UPI00100DCDE9|nr:zf-HC2 domain-containing protein [Ammoniphilus sp. CFH 90114]RXT05321.1 anti-sigma factor [Ammoniphilus sp. CFH 90114]
MNCEQATRLIHDFLDDDLSRHDELELKKHLLQCTDCKGRFHALQQTIALVQSASHIYAPADFTDRVLAALPKETAVQILKKRLQRHPFLVAASLFILMMTGSTTAYWIEDKQFQLSADQLQKLEIDNVSNKVIVPANSVVNGDIMVRNADITIEGQVQGNVVAIDGRIYLASTGSIMGEKEEINQAVEWVWYNLKKVAYQIIP